MNHSTAENFMRSAKAPMISAGVMAAKVSWNIAKIISGMYTPLEKVAPAPPASTPDRKSLPKPPKNWLPPVKATL